MPFRYPDTEPDWPTVDEHARDLVLTANLSLPLVTGYGEAADQAAIAAGLRAAADALENPRGPLGPYDAVGAVMFQAVYEVGRLAALCDRLADVSAAGGEELPPR